MPNRRTFMTIGAAATFMWPGLANGQTPGKRFALIIGNDTYPATIGELRNAVNDAKLVARVLGQCGFEIPDGALVTNGSKDTIELQARAHANRLAAAGKDALGFVYYAGHGAARPGGDNYIIPILPPDVDVRTATVWDRSIGLEWLFKDAFAGLDASQIIAIDACRNELRTNERSVGGNGSYVIRGLEVVSNEAAANLFLSFATWQGNTASDGARADGNGPYALALANALVTAGPIDDRFREVRFDVLERTNPRQEVMNVSRLGREASQLTIGGGVDPTIIPAVGRPSSGAAASAPRSIWRPVNLALVLSCSYAGQRRALTKASSDAEKVATALTASDFDVSAKQDLNWTDMRREIRSFAGRLREKGKAATGVLYFAGHSIGLTFNSSGSNYLIPEGQVPTHLPNVPGASVDVAWILDELVKAKAEAVVVFVDGCRSIGLEGAVGKVLATSVVAEYGERNVLVSFSAAPSGFAQDGPDGSYFADALAREIRDPNRRYLQQMMAAVSARVQQASQGKMRPSYVTSTRTPIYFRDGTGLGG